MSQEAFEAALIDKGVARSLASEVAAILANDNPSLPNLGRTPEQQTIIARAWQEVSNAR